jgi:hypothetical protein
VTGAGLVIAVLMLRNHLLARTVVYLGVLANALLDAPGRPEADDAA